MIGATTLVAICLAVGRVAGYGFALQCAAAGSICASIVGMRRTRLWLAQLIVMASVMGVAIFRRLPPIFISIEQVLGAIAVGAAVWTAIHRKIYLASQNAASPNEREFNDAQYVMEARNAAKILTAGTCAAAAIFTVAIGALWRFGDLDYETAIRLQALVGIVSLAALMPCYLAAAVHRIWRKTAT